MATSAIMSGLQFDALPYEEGRCLELLEGDLIEVSSPTPRHQAIVRRIVIALRQYLGEQKGRKPRQDQGLPSQRCHGGMAGLPRSQTVEIHRGATGISLDATQSISSDLLPGLQIPIASFFV